MIWFWIAVTLLHKLFLGLATGASTFALTFYINGIQDGTIDPSERRFMGIVYFVLRLALAVIIATQLILLSSFLPDKAGTLFSDPTFVLNWVIIAVIIGNATLMHFHKMPMWLGPALAGGSWYSLFLLHSWPGGIPLTFAALLGVYVGFVALFLGVFTLVRKTFVPPKSLVQPPSEPVIS